MSSSGLPLTIDSCVLQNIYQSDKGRVYADVLDRLTGCTFRASFPNTPVDSLRAVSLLPVRLRGFLYLNRLSNGSHIIEVRGAQFEDAYGHVALERKRQSQSS